MRTPLGELAPTEVEERSQHTPAVVERHSKKRTPPAPFGPASAGIASGGPACDRAGARDLDGDTALENVTLGLERMSVARERPEMPRRRSSRRLIEATARSSEFTVFEDPRGNIGLKANAPIAARTRALTAANEHDDKEN